MLASRQSRTKRRGIVLILVLGMLALMAVIGVTFATYSGQQKISARNYLGSVLQPQADELLDFALSQLIGDTSDVRSAIRGHSLARDMYGNDAFYNGYMTTNPQTGQPFAITNVVAVTGSNLFDITTNIQNNDPNLYGINFTRWIMRVSYNGNVPTYGNKPVDSTLEILIDNTTSGQNRIFRVSPIDTPLSATPVDNPGAGNSFNVLTALYNPTLGSTSNLAMNVATGGAPAPSIPASLGSFSFSLDGRYLRAFNGTGMGATFINVNGVATAVNPAYGNFRYNGPIYNNLLTPQTVAMDEDYDACDLENWYLALQSADGQVMIPSFHRPAAVRYDPQGLGGAVVNDWQRVNQDPNPATGGTGNWATSAARILRPVAADGNDAATFPDLIPDSLTGKINYDVDNDGDGLTDSVWVDLGYPARRDSKGQLYKPLFAFMVIGLNGRIPLNTAGNLADLRDASAPVTGYTANPNPPPAYLPVLGSGAGASHASHLGNSISEIDPTYGLQNAFMSPLVNTSSNDFVAAFAAPQTGVLTTGTSTATALNTQIDNAGIDVRLTQLRNILSGTRPPAGGGFSGVNNENNFVFSSSGPSAGGLPLYMPNGIADAFDSSTTDPNGFVYVTRTTQPVPGRWGEAQAIPGVPFANPNYAQGNGQPQYVDVVFQAYNNPVRAGYSMDPTDIIYGTPRDMADDNYNSFDPWPLGHTGEAGDLDYYDYSGALLLPVDRMRRWLTPADINGTGAVSQWNPGAAARVNNGADLFGRVEFFSYFRPPGAAGFVNYEIGNTFPSGYRWGAVSISYPTSGTPYVPDTTNNPLHNFEAFRFPSQNYAANGNAPGPNAPGAFTPQRIGGMPLDLSVDANNMPTLYPTYDYQVNQVVHSDGLNEADELNLYTYNPILDSPYGPSDLEWLYRQQDVDGKSLSSRLKQLAPVSFTNGLDSQRRRRLFALDAFESNGFAWTNDNPGNVFPNNSRFSAGQNASMLQNALNTNSTSPTPALAQRDRKINLNYPLPVSNDPNEPIRQKWISDAYQLLKVILPPRAVDTPEELAQLSQFLINVIDFRDPDSTMTHWVNPDVVITNVQTGAAGPPTAATMPASLTFYNPLIAFAPGTIQLDQYGMEYNPVAINEAIAFSYTYQTTATGGGGTGATGPQANRFLIELVNTLTAAEQSVSAAASGPPPGLDLGGMLQPASASVNDPYARGAWDIVFTGDDPYSRPDPIRGELPRFGNIYGLVPLNGGSFTPLAGSGATFGSDVILQPLLAQGSGANGTSIPLPVPPMPTSLAVNYFYVFGNSPPPLAAGGGGGGGGSGATYQESGPLVPGSTYTGTFFTGGPLNNYTMPLTTLGAAPSPVIQSLNASMGFDPFQSGVGATNPSINLYPGVLPGIDTAGGTTPTTTPPMNFSWKVPMVPLPSSSGGAGTATQRGTQFIWVCLRRPANLFAPVSAYNPMVVVDSMRIPYIDGTGASATTASLNDNGTNVSVPSVIGNFNTIYSVQRFQPYRGGHAVPAPAAVNYGFTGSVYAIPASAATTIDTRYGFSEQVVPPSVNSLPYVNPPGLTGTASAALTQGIYFYQDATIQTAATYPIYHTLGLPNEWEMGSGMTYTENWDYLPFHDRDFTSVAELVLVPASAPGLFTKQFVEFAPSQQNVFTFFSGSPPFNPGTQILTPAPSSVTSTTMWSPSGAVAQVLPGVPAGSGNNATIFAQAGYASNTSKTAPGGNTNNPQPYLPLFTYAAAATITPATAYGPAPGYLYASTAGAGGGGGGATAGTMAAYVNVGTASVPFIFAGAINTAAMPVAGTTTQPAASPAQITPIPIPTPPLQPHSYPYLSDKFFYTGTSDSADSGSVPAATSVNGYVGGHSADGWFKMFEFFEVPSQMIGAIGPVMQGTNFDWARQDFKPGLLNLNLIIDEEVYLSLLGDQSINQQNGYYQVGDPTTGTMTTRNEFDQFTQQLLNMGQVQPLPAGNYTPNGTALSISATGPPYRIPLAGPGAGGPVPAPIPLVVTATLSNGAPASAYPLSSTSLGSWQNWASMGVPYQAYPQSGPGLLAADPIANFNYQTANPGGPLIYNNGLKSSFVQFLWLRHGGSGYMFGWGSGAVGQNVAYGGANGTPGGATIPADIPFHSLSYPDIDYTIMRPAALPPTTFTNPAPTSPAANPATGAMATFYSGDPGVRGPGIYVGMAAGGGYVTTTVNPVYTSGYYPGVTVGLTTNGLLATNYPVYPPPVPARRLFQAPDFYPGTVGSVPSPSIPAPSNASETGDPFVNNTTPPASTPPIPAPGVLSSSVQSSTTTSITTVPSNAMVNLYWQNGNAAIEYQASATGTTATPVPGAHNPYLGSKIPPSGAIVAADFRQHPYWQSEQMQRVMNLTTVRTHQYAVWITIAFFQVKRQGDIGMATFGAPNLAFDIMGPEKGALDGTNVRYRAFYLIDRLKVTGFDPGNAGQYHQAVVYRQRIEF
jgi:hypothetical protein